MDPRMMQRALAKEFAKKTGQDDFGGDFYTEDPSYYEEGGEYYSGDAQYDLGYLEGDEYAQGNEYYEENGEYYDQGENGEYFEEQDEYYEDNGFEEEVEFGSHFGGVTIPDDEFKFGESTQIDSANYDYDPQLGQPKDDGFGDYDASHYAPQSSKPERAPPSHRSNTVSPRQPQAPLNYFESPFDQPELTPAQQPRQPPPQQTRTPSHQQARHEPPRQGANVLPKPAARPPPTQSNPPPQRAPQQRPAPSQVQQQRPPKVPQQRPDGATEQRGPPPQQQRQPPAQPQRLANAQRPPQQPQPNQPSSRSNYPPQSSNGTQPPQGLQQRPPPQHQQPVQPPQPQQPHYRPPQVHQQAHPPPQRQTYNPPGSYSQSTPPPSRPSPGRSQVSPRRAIGPDDPGPISTDDLLSPRFNHPPARTTSTVSVAGGGSPAPIRGPSKSVGRAVPPPVLRASNESNGSGGSGAGPPHKAVPPVPGGRPPLSASAHVLGGLDTLPPRGAGHDPQYGATSSPSMLIRGPPVPSRGPPVRATVDVPYSGSQESLRQPRLSAGAPNRSHINQLNPSPLATPPTFRPSPRARPMSVYNLPKFKGNPFEGLPPHDDPATFRMLFLCEDQHTFHQVVHESDTVESIKALLVQNPSTRVSADVAKKLQFKICGAGFITNEHEPISEIPYFQNCRKRRADPLFMLVVKGSEYQRVIKHDSVTLGALLGTPLAWGNHDDENTAFRQCMARIRLQERRYVQKKREEIGHDVPINIGDNEIHPDKKVFVTLVISKIQTKKVAVSHSETADEFLERTFRYSALQGEWYDYVFKAVGYREYFVGPHRLVDFEYIQRNAHTGVKLMWIPRAPVEVPASATSYQFEHEEEFLSNDPVIKYSHAELTRAGGVPQSNKSFDSLHLTSVWDLQVKDFRVRIQSCENLNLKSPLYAKGSTVFVKVGIYDGTELLSPEQVTMHMPFEGNVRWNTFAATTLKLSDLPRNTKLCFTLYALKSKKKVDKAEPIGWVNCLIYNYKHELRTGKVILRMWPNGEAKPEYTCTSNNADTDATVLHIEFADSPSIVVFPTEPLDLPRSTSLPSPTHIEMGQLDAIFRRHALEEMSDADKALVWKYRETCKEFALALPKFLRSAPRTDRIAVQEMHRLLNEWALIEPVDALELLDARYADLEVRAYAVKQLERLGNGDTEDYLLQLVQVLKFEPYHDCPLTRFLLRRAIRNKRIGHYLYWYLKSELNNPQVSERFGLILEAFLTGGGEGRAEIAAQEKVNQALVGAAYKVKALKDPKEGVSALQAELRNLNAQWPQNCQLSLDPGFVTKGIIVEKCKVMDSKMRPLWLLFENADPMGDNMYVIFKAGDDLRQDMLTLQMFRIMDKIWKRDNLDLMLNPYGVISTGDQIGMIEVVTSSQTVSKIQKQMAGSMGAFKDEVLFKWLQEKNPDELDLKSAVENFTSSCAGYCVATYVLGIGDRHNDNIMVKEDGHLFHIDFGHILGNFKKKLGFKRERVPFVFTPDWAFVMGGKSSTFYVKFVSQCMAAHQMLRKRGRLFVNLFSMMLISGMPELQTNEDLLYIVDTLGLNAENADTDFKQLIDSTGSQMSTRVNFFIHNLVH